MARQWVGAIDQVFANTLVVQESKYQKLQMLLVLRDSWLLDPQGIG